MCDESYMRARSCCCHREQEQNAAEILPGVSALVSGAPFGSAVRGSQQQQHQPTREPLFLLLFIILEFLHIGLPLPFFLSFFLLIDE